MRPDKKIAVIGSAVVDLYLNGLDHWPKQKGERAKADNIEYYPGGNGPNVAINLAKLGGFDVSLFTAVGLGGNADMIRRSCKFWNPDKYDSESLHPQVRLVLNPVEDEVHTTLSIIRLDANNEPTYVYCPNASKHINKKFLKTYVNEFAECALLYLAGLGTLPALQFTDLAEIVSKVRARNKEITIVADVNLISDQAAINGGVITTLPVLLNEIDYFIPNEAEAVQYSGKTEIGEAAKTFNRLVRTATVIKRGERGVIVFARASEKGNVTAAYSDTEIQDFVVQDANGAGDAWGAGFVASVLRNTSLSETCLFANAVAAHCIMSRGATANTKSYEWMQEWIKNNSQPGEIGLAE